MEVLRVKELILVICFAGLIFCGIAIVKNVNTFRCHCKIDKAIYEYKDKCIGECDWTALHSVEYNDAEDYMTTFWRFWDWGYARILPKDKFEIIKPYIR